MMIGFTFVFLQCQAPMYAQTSSLQGVVTDKSSGEPLAKVKVTVQYLRNTSLVFYLKTDKKGKYYKGGLRNGMYRVSFEKEGFVPARTSLRILAAEKHTYDAALEVLKVQNSGQTFGLVEDARELLAKGKYDAAIAKVTEAIAKDPSAFILYYNRAVAYEKKGDADKALQDYDKSLELKPDFILSLAAAGKINAKKANFEKAAGYYKKAFDQGITDTLALYNYGACLVNLGNSSEAQKVFEKLIALDANYADAYYQLGIIYLGLNDSAKAKEYLKKFIELDPENENVSVAKEILKTI
jgi:tetratricopeptide (TPR) repeat protein